MAALQARDVNTTPAEPPAKVAKKDETPEEVTPEVAKKDETPEEVTPEVAKKDETPEKVPVAIGADVLLQLSQLQSGLNSRIDKEWRTNRKADDWGLAITLEAAELIDSYPWKWWKNVKGKVDVGNVRIELVDILHFSLSGQMQVGGDGGVADGAGIQSPLTDTQNAVATFRRVISLTERHAFASITKMVIEAAADLEFNLVAYYVAKHTLNYIRQLGGYKDGTYKKVNAGMEDNELLHQCIEGVTVEHALGNFPAVASGIMTKVYDVFQVGEENRRRLSDWSA